jgi:hypothetical protein
VRLNLLDGKDVERLNNQEFQSIMNALLTAEAGRWHVPLLDLDLSTRQTDPDAGIDARVKWSTDGHDILKIGENVIQYKSGKLSLAELRTEFRKPGVQDTLNSGGAYLILVGQDYVRKDVVSRREKELRRLCARKKIPSDQATILFGNAIARWISRYPAVVARQELRQNIHEFKTVERWRRDNAQMLNPFKADPERTDTIKRIHGFLDSTAGEPIFRLEGLAGVGKTRLVLEAVNDPKYESQTLYALNAEGREVQPFLSWIHDGPERSAIAVIDECDATKQNALAPYAANSGGRLKLICVGVSEVLYKTTPVDVVPTYQLHRLADSYIDAILREAFPAAPNELIQLSVKLSEGYVKLAMFMFGIMDKFGPLSPLQLADAPTIRQFLHRFVPPETLKGLQVLSLLARVGWEENLQEEAKTIAKFVGLPFSKLQSAVALLRRQGVVVPRGRYLYVSPDLLAVEAAAYLWDEKGSGLVDLVLKLKPSPRRQLLQRLAMMGEHEQVRKAVERILSRNGLFPTLKELDEPFLGEVFRILSHAVPGAAIDLLDELILPASKEDLLGFEKGRREVLWAIESLRRWPNTSLRAARIATRLALEETEKLGNNATAIFTTFFHVFLSGSPVPLMDRFVLIDELLASEHPIARSLAVTALGATLELHESRSGGEIDELSKKHYPAEWRPETNAEVWEPRRTALAYLKKIGNGSDEAAVAARRERMWSVRALLQYGQADDALGVLESSTPGSDEERRAILESCDWLSKLKGLPSDFAARIEKVRETAFGTDYFSRLRRWVGKRIHGDFDMESASGYGAADNQVQRLAEEGFAEGLGERELSWLASPEAEHVWIFGHRLGELDREGKFFSEIVKVTPNDVNCMLLASYVRGRGAICGDGTRERMLDALVEEKPDAAFGATWRNDASVDGAERVILIVSSGRVAGTILRVLLYGAWANKLPTAYTVKILTLMLDTEPQANAESVLGIIDQSIHAERITVAEFGDVIWQALETKANPRSPNFDWHWAEVARHIAPLDPARFTHIFVSFFESDNTWLGTDSAQSVLRNVAASDPKPVWEVIGPALAREDSTGVRLRIKLQHWFGELIPPELLLPWARKHGRRGTLMAASLLNPRAGLSDAARLLVKESSKPEEVLSNFAAAIGTGVFTGSISNHMQGELPILEKWAQDEEPKIRNFAKRALKHQQQRIQRQKLLEEEELF